MAVIKSFGVLSFGKVQGLLMGLLGIILGLIYGIVGFFMGLNSFGSALAGLGIAAAAIVGIPLIYGGLGFIGGLIGAALYNFIADKFGGIEMEVVKH
jgi:hypothetical protein